METQTQTQASMQTNGKQDLTKTVNLTGAEAVILSLIEEEADTVFGYVGGAIMPVYDALYNHQDKLNHIMVRHEQALSMQLRDMPALPKRQASALLLRDPEQQI